MLARYLELADKALQHVASVVTYGSDNRPQDKDNPVKFAEAKRRINLINQLRSQEVNSRLNRGQKVSIYNNLEITRDLVDQYKSGNCFDQSAICFFYLVMDCKLTNVSIVGVYESAEEKSSKHAMVLIQASNTADSVIIDPHNGECHPLQAYLLPSEGQKPAAFHYGSHFKLQCGMDADGLPWSMLKPLVWGEKPKSSLLFFAEKKSSESSDVSVVRDHFNTLPCSGGPER
jgi:hypothetical protein